MKLRTRIVLIVFSLFCALVAAQLVVQDRILMPGFAELERGVAHTDMERVANALRRDLSVLGNTAADWGNWKDSWQFIEDRNEQFVVDNMNPESLGAIDAGVMAFLDADGRVVYEYVPAPESGEVLDSRLFESGALPAGHPWITMVREGRPVEGMLRTAGGPMLVAVSPILDGFGNGPHRGAVLVGRLLSPDEVDRIGEQAQASIAMSIAPPEARDRDVLPAGLSLGPAEVLVEQSAVSEVHRVFHDVAGDPLFVFRADIPRAITAKGRETVGYASLFLILAGAAVLVAVVLFVNVVVLRPLAAVTRQAVVIGEADDLTVRLSLARRDELGMLAREFDGMIERLAEARRQIVDKSFEAGIAEMASGVLHNVGNALTPLGVRVAGLRDLLRRAPAGDIDLVLAELGRCGGDAQRRQELTEFLGLAGAELARTITVAREDAAAIADGMQVIHEALGEQTRFARNARVVEAVEVPRLLTGSLQLVPGDRRARLAVEPDESLARLGPVPVARVTLQQVFQNLVVNAAEAVGDARERSRLVVRGERTARDGREWLRLRFEDDGVGIAPEHLDRVFEKGFSTKPRETNAGIGLHWCANAMNALGGSIRAESRGAGCGATFELYIPLQPVADEAPVVRAA